jgi:ketosteroid isomerase-like protein
VNATLGADDFVAVMTLVHRYADAVVNRDSAQWGACWAPDARWTLGPGRDVEGRDAIVELWRSAMGNFTAVVQTVANGTAWHQHGSADHAGGRWYISERFCRADGTRGILQAHYDDTYVRRDGEWLFASRALRVHYIGAPDLSAEFLNTTGSV